MFDTDALCWYTKELNFFDYIKLVIILDIKFGVIVLR